METFELQAKTTVPRISVDGEREIVWMLNRYHGIQFDAFHFFLDVGTEIGEPVEILMSGRNVDGRKAQLTGKLTKRIRKYLKWRNSLELTAQDMSRIANITDNYRLPEQKLYIKHQDRPYTKWSGQFGDRNSCFYREYAGMLYGWEEDSDAFGIEFYDADMKPYGRLLGYYGAHDYIVVMNGHTVDKRSNATEHLAQLYAEMMKQQDSATKMIRTWEEHPHLDTYSSIYIIGNEADEYVEGDFSFDSVFEYPTVECNCGGHAIMTEICEGTCQSCGETLMNPDLDCR